MQIRIEGYREQDGGVRAWGVAGLALTAEFQPRMVDLLSVPVILKDAAGWRMSVPIVIRDESL